MVTCQCQLRAIVIRHCVVPALLTTVLLRKIIGREKIADRVHASPINIFARRPFRKANHHTESSDRLKP